MPFVSSVWPSASDRQAQPCLWAAHLMQAAALYSDLFLCQCHVPPFLLFVPVGRVLGSQSWICRQALLLALHLSRGHLGVPRAGVLSSPFLTQIRSSCWLDILRR